jgi:hypothetical protein
MLKLGNLIAEDVFLIENLQVQNLETWKSHYHYYIINNEFKAVKIGIPFDIDTIALQEILEFLESTSINFKIFNYFKLIPNNSISKLIEANPEYVIKNQVHILANQDVNYKTIGETSSPRSSPAWCWRATAPCR